MPVDLNNAPSLKYYLVASADKLALGAFMKFLIRKLGSGYPICSTHSLMTEESQKEHLKYFIDNNGKGILSHYIRKSTVIPDYFKDAVDVVFWFNKYDAMPTIVKSPEGHAMPLYLIEEWRKAIQA